MEHYWLLEQVTPSAMHRLNRAVAMAEWKGPGAGLAVLKDFEPPAWLAGSYQWAAVLADIGAVETPSRLSGIRKQRSSQPPPPP